MGSSTVVFTNIKISTRKDSNSPSVEQLIDAFARLDIEAISNLMPEDAEYEGYSNKYGFLAEYKVEFEDYMANYGISNLPLMVVDASCTYCAFKYECVNTKQVFCFTDHINGINTFTIVFEIDNEGELLEMYRCNNSQITYEGKVNI